MKALLLSMLLLYRCAQPEAPITARVHRPKPVVYKGVDQTIFLSNGVQVKGVVKGSPGNYEIFLPGDTELKLNDKWLYEQNGKIWMKDVYDINGQPYEVSISSKGMLFTECTDGKLYFREQLPEHCLVIEKK